MDFEQQKLQSIVFLPDGRPAPAVLTAEETISLLRLDNKNPGRTLKFYRDEGLLVGVRLGKRLRYPLAEVLRFLVEKAEKQRATA